MLFKKTKIWKCLQLLFVLFQQLSDTDHTVRKKCLQLFGALARPDTDAEPSEGTEKSPQEVLDEYTRDTDPRVRHAAFKALVMSRALSKKKPSSSNCL